MVVNSLCLLVPLPPCPKVIRVNPLRGIGINILTWFMLIWLLATVSSLEAFGMLSSLLTKLLATIKVLA